MTLRDYLAANMFDGDGEGGRVTMDVKTLLDEVCENVALWMIKESGAEQRVDAYYGVDS